MLTGNTNEERIWNYLRSKGFSPAGVAGIMGNMYAESGLLPNNLENTGNTKLGMTDEQYTNAVDKGTYTNFVKDSLGYGLCQWTYYTRKQALLDFAKKTNKSIGDLEMQLDFLMEEMNTLFKTVMASLKSVTSVKAGSDAFLLNVEKPAGITDSLKAKRAGYAQSYYNKYASTSTSQTTTQKGESTMAFKVGDRITTAAQLAEALRQVATNYKTLYVMGCFGAPMTAANKTRYINNGSHNNYNLQPTRQAMIKAASDDTFGFDCVCLIKGVLWGWNGDKTKNYGGAGYAVNGVPDIGADIIINVCKEVSTDFTKIEIGELLWGPGHVGLYIGGGLAVECTPAWENKVQITACNYAKAGYQKRIWSKHGKLPYVSYTGKSENPSTANPSSVGTTTPPSSNSTSSSTSGSASTSTSNTTKVTEKTATGVAKSFDRTLAGTYTVTAPGGLNIRNAAGTDNPVLGAIPSGTKVQNYGYYTEVGGTKWLYVQVTYNGVKYTGFSSMLYLKK